MRQPSGAAITIPLIALILLSGCVATQTPPRASPTSAPSPSSETVRPHALALIEDNGVLRLIDPTTGDERWHGGAQGATLSVVSGRQGVLLASVAAADGSTTSIMAVSLDSLSPTSVGTVPGRVSLRGLSQDGTTLYFVNGAGGPQTDVPDTIMSIPLPVPWQGTPSEPVLRASDPGGLLAPDGRAWYHLDQKTLLFAEYPSPGVPRISQLAIPTEYAYFSLLRAPDNRRLYVVDYRESETVHVVDVTQHTLVRSVPIRSTGTKQTWCAATLSPDGGRLYVIGHDQTGGDGIDVIDTSTLQRVATYLPGRRFSCLAVSPDGNQLYATNGNPLSAQDKVSTLTTIDAKIGNEDRTVAIPILSTPAIALVAN